MTHRLKTFLAANSGYTSTQAALAFAALGIVGAVFVTPMMDRGTLPGNFARLDASKYDLTTTAGVRSSSRDRAISIQRSVLQPKGSRGCVIFDSGRREGDC
ncbi:hypothetical protein N9H93_05755 [Rhizobiaceae bacterium]|nr:hypothetical protein [Rhizobiaceae bacterium]